MHAGFSWEFAVAGAGILALVIQLYHYLFRFGKLAFHKPAERPVSQDPVSVVICARNEIVNLQNNLESFLNQEYPEFQVVVVNDCSWDETGDYLEAMAERHPNLKVVTIKEQERYQHGKKFALSLGIKAASYDILLLSDADCKPVSADWISRMISSYSNGIEIVIGYGGYMKRPGFLNRIIRMDTVFTAIQYLSSALAGKTYMGVGRNLSYRKSLFFKNKGFASHNHVLSGDDDLFVNETARPDNVFVQLHPDAFTLSVPRTSFKGWFRQKKRHISTSSHYQSRHRRVIGSFFFSQFLFYASCIALLVSGNFLNFVLGAWLFRLVIQMVIFGNSMKRLRELDNLWMVPVFDIMLMFLYPSIVISNKLVKPKAWI